MKTKHLFLLFSYIYLQKTWYKRLAKKIYTVFAQYLHNEFTETVTPWCWVAELVYVTDKGSDTKSEDKQREETHAYNGFPDLCTRSFWYNFLTAYF